MSKMHFEQENNGLTGIQSFNKFQTPGFNAKVNVAKTPITKPFSASLKTPMTKIKSSRKAFGNVSNVLSGIKTIGTKVEHKSKSVAKDCLKREDMKPIETQVERDSNLNSKYTDEIESMFAIEEEVMSEVNDPITHDLFAINEQTIFEMQFDSQMDEFMVPPKNTNLNIDELF